jgi:hypothetical protein
MATDQGQVPVDPHAAAGPPVGYPPQPGYAEPPAEAPKRGNAPAILSIVLFFLPVVGLVLGIIGLARAGRRGRRAAAVIGLILAILVNLFTGFTVYAANFTNLNTVSDPGCRAAEKTLSDLPADSNDPTALKQRLQTAVDGLTAAAAKADHDNTKAAILAMRDDYQELLNNANAGTAPPQSVLDKGSHDLDRIDELCSFRWHPAP